LVHTSQPLGRLAAGGRHDGSPETGHSTRLIWIAVILLAATMAGFIAGLWPSPGGGDAAAAILTGGGAFGTATLVLLAIAHFAVGQQR
jgi:hypothetical protein